MLKQKCMYIAAMLVPVFLLAQGSSIAQDSPARPYVLRQGSLYVGGLKLEAPENFAFPVFRSCGSDDLFLLAGRGSSLTAISDFYRNEGLASDQSIYVVFVGDSSDTTFEEPQEEYRGFVDVYHVLAIGLQIPARC